MKQPWHQGWHINLVNLCNFKLLSWWVWANHGYYHGFSSLITPKTNMEKMEIPSHWLSKRIWKNLGVKHVLPIFLDIIRSSVKSIHKLPTTKAPNAALNGRDGEDIPGCRALTRHHISTPEKAAGDFQSWNIHGNIMNLWMEERFMLPLNLENIFLVFRCRNDSNSDRNWWELGGSGGMSWFLNPCIFASSFAAEKTTLGTPPSYPWLPPVAALYHPGVVTPKRNGRGLGIWVDKRVTSHSWIHHHQDTRISDIFRIGDLDKPSLSTFTVGGRSKAYCIHATSFSCSSRW